MGEGTFPTATQNVVERHETPVNCTEVAPDTIGMSATVPEVPTSVSANGAPVDVVPTTTHHDVDTHEGPTNVLMVWPLVNGRVHDCTEATLLVADVVSAALGIAAPAAPAVPELDQRHPVTPTSMITVATKAPRT